MNAQWMTGFVLVILEAVTFGYMYDSYLFPIGIAIASLVGLSGKIRIEVSRDRMQILALVLAVILGLKYGLAPKESVSRTTLFMDYAFGYSLSQFILILQVSLFFIGKEKRLPPIGILFGAMIMILAGRIVSNPFMMKFYIFEVLLFLGFASLYAASDPKHLPKEKQSRGIVYLALYAFLAIPIFGFTLAEGRFLEIMQDDVGRLVGGFMTSGHASNSVGFSDRSYLGSITRAKEMEESKIRLRIDSPVQPGYLRAKTYQVYEAKSWKAELEKSDLYPVEKSAEGLSGKGDPFFTLEKKLPTDLLSCKVWPETEEDIVIFLPLETAAFEARTPKVLVDDSKTLQWPQKQSRKNYTYYLPSSENSSEGPSLITNQNLYLSLPDNLDPRVIQLSKKLFQDCPDTESKIKAVKHYFLANYKYNLGIQVPPGEDPLTYFLLEQPSAHCEYFATGTTILLRLGGVPCRYVTGFVAVDRNPVGDYWTARNKDAHAWVEAYDEKQGWVLVESTPPEESRQLRNEGLLLMQWILSSFSSRKSQHFYRELAWKESWKP